MTRILLVLRLPLFVAALAFSPMYFEAATLKPQVMGRRGVVAAGHPLVAEAGMRILQRGGNAVDAGVATVFAAAVVEQSSFGMGGEAPILIKLAGKPAVAINGAGIAPQLATAEFYEKPSLNDPRHGPFPATISGKSGVIPSYGPLSAIVPGAVDALRLSREKASPAHLPGDPARMQTVAAEDFIRARFRHRNAEHQDTTCVNVIDKAGNMFSATPSGAWIPAVISGDTGIPLTQRARSFVLTPGHPNQIAPRKRPRITLTPTVALRDGKPWLAFSTPGGDSQDQTLLQVFLNMVEFGMGPQEAVEAPRVNSLAMYSSFDDHADQPLGLQIEKRVPESVRERLTALGHKLIVQDDWGNPTSPTVVEFDAANGVIRGGADVRRHRYALAW